MSLIFHLFSFFLNVLIIIYFAVYTHYLHFVIFLSWALLSGSGWPSSLEHRGSSSASRKLKLQVNTIEPHLLSLFWSENRKRFCWWFTVEDSKQHFCVGSHIYQLPVVLPRLGYKNSKGLLFLISKMVIIMINTFIWFSQAQLPNAAKLKKYWLSSSWPPPEAAFTG